MTHLEIGYAGLEHPGHGMGIAGHAVAGQLDNLFWRCVLAHDLLCLVPLYPCKSLLQC